MLPSDFHQLKYHGHSFEPCWNTKQNGTANKSLSYRKYLLQTNYVLVMDIKTKTAKILSLRKWDSPSCRTDLDKGY